MTKLFSVFLLVAALGFLAAPAQADTSFSFGVSSHGGHRHSYRPFVHRHAPFRPMAYAWPSYGPYVAPSYVVVRHPPVVYAPSYVVQAAPSYAPPAAKCREYQSRVTVSGAPAQAYGTACLQPDGSWRVVD